MILILSRIFWVSSFYLTQTGQHMGNATKYIHHTWTMVLWSLYESFTLRINSGMSHAFHFCTLCVNCILESTLFRLYWRFWIILRGILSYCLSLHAISGKVCTTKETHCDNKPGSGNHKAWDYITDWRLQFTISSQCLRINQGPCVGNP